VLVDAQRSSGFSFTDLAADRAGLAFSEAVLSGRVTLEQVEKEFSVAMFVPAIGGLRDGLALADVFAKSGNPQPLYTRSLADIRSRISDLAGYRENLGDASGPLRPEEVAIIAVRDSATSREVAAYYAKSRGIPPSRICWIDVVPGKDLERDYWESSVRPAIRNWLLQQKLETKIRCLATVWDVPLKIGKRLGDTEHRVAFLRADRQLRAQQVSEQVGKIRALLADKDASDVVEMDTNDSTEKFRKLLQTELVAAQKRVNSATPADRAMANTRLLQSLTTLGGLQAVAAVMKEQKADTPEAQQGITQQLEFAKGRLMGLREAIGSLSQMPDSVERDEQVVSIVVVAEGAIGAMTWLDLQLELLKKNETYSSFDSELSLLFWLDYPVLRWQPNLLHYRYDGSPLRQRRHTLMVSRLEAPTVELTKKLIDNAIAVEEHGLAGKMYLDARGMTGEPGKNAPGSYGDYDQALRDLDKVLRDHSKQPVVLDNKPELFQDGDCPDTSLYCGWYSLSTYVDAFDFKPGSVGYHMASGEAATLRHADSQVWCKRMLEDGICATLGPVHEPYLAAFPRPDEFFIALMSGEYGLVESYYRTKPFNSWVMVLVGDPLYNPFRTRPAIHPAELPKNLRAVIAAPTDL